MPTPILTRLTDPAALLERAVDGLLPPQPLSAAPDWPTLPAWIVLRQGGLRDDLHRLAAARGVAGWFDNPILLFTELLDRWGPPDTPTPLSEPERHALLSRLLDAHGAALLPRGHTDAWVPAVDRLVGELIAEDVAAEDFARAASSAADDDFSRRRADALGAVYAAWRETLLRVGRSDGRDARARLARAVREQPDGFAARLGGRREIRIVGLADLRGGWAPLLAALADSPALDRVEILTSAALDISGAGAGEEASAPIHAPSAAALRLIQAPDSAREVERVAVEVRALLDAGAAPHRVAVVARQARPSVDAVAEALAAIGVPVTARRRTALAHTTPGRALLTILDVPREQWSRHAVAELAEHPLLETGLDATIINTVGFARAMSSAEAWAEGLDDLERRAAARERGETSEEYRRSALPPAARVQDTRAAWTRVEPMLRDLEEPRSLEDWCAWAVNTLVEDAWGIGRRLAEPLDDDATWYRELRARDRIRTLLEEWRDAGARFGGNDAPMDATRFSERLRLILSQDLVTPPVTDSGVLVAEALAAGWRAFDHVFVIGLAAGEFPLRPASTGLLDRHERESLRIAGLPLDAPDAWRTREQELFRVLCAAPRQSLTLSWPALDSEGREVARSAYVDELASAEPVDEMPPEAVLVAGFPTVGSADAAAQAERAAHIETERPTAYAGFIEDATAVAWLAERYGEAYPWSATQLEGLAKCPWSWFAERVLHVDERRDADDLIEPSVAGSLRHEALELFFVRAIEERGAPVVIGEADAAWCDAGIEVALREVWSAAESKGVWLGPTPTRALQYDELLGQLRAYLAYERTFNDHPFAKGNVAGKKVIRSGVMRTEFPFKDVELDGGGVRFRLRGLVDRIDQGEDERVPDAERYLTAIDYKSSRGSTPGAGVGRAWADGIVLQVPLYAKALQVLFPDHIVARMEYRTIGNKAERVHCLDLHPVKSGSLVDAPEAEDKLERALEAAGARIAATRAGELPTAPTASAGCSPYCVARDFCRIPGGPVDASGWRR